MSTPSKSLFSTLAAELSFSKYQGLGNDFLMLDGRGAADPEFVFGLTPELVVELCDRRFGIGCDQLLVVGTARDAAEDYFRRGIELFRQAHADPLYRFTGFEINPALKAEAFQFHPPAGTDVIRP